ncbi:MAG: gamma-glutamyltransferase [Pseudoxanthomonas suwonensis]|nr:gamma-glutamyltransferase [Pseudoxanthomonas suwonensis]
MLLLPLLLLGPATAFSQTQQLLNYREIQKPVTGSGGMVVSQNEAASRVGVEVLEQGGHAVDAAVAMAFAMAVTLPRAGNIGGDGFMLVHDAATGRTSAVDFRSTAPEAATLERFIGSDGRITGQSQGWLAAGVPGTPAGLELAHRRFGRLPWAQLVEPARRLAADGIELTRDEAFALSWGRERLGTSSAALKAFSRADGTPLQAGDRHLQPDLAWSLAQIQEHGADAFYRGAIAERIDAGMRRHGGLLRLQDLQAYRALEREPLRTRYRDAEVVAMPLASAGGVGVMQMLRMLEHFDLAAMGPRSADALHHLAEVMKLAWRDRERYAGDPGFHHVPLAALLRADYLQARARLVDPVRAAPVDAVRPGTPSLDESPETTHLSVVDRDGNAVSLTYTLGSDFGSGVMVEGTGFLFGNLIGNFSLAAQRDGQRQQRTLTSNAIAPGRRPVSSMTPTMVFRDGALWFVTGSPGGNTIPGTVVQTILDVVDFGLGVAESANAPRIHQDLRSGELRMERGISPDTRALLVARGHTLADSETIGSSQTILRNGALLEGAPDPRRPGATALATGP